jgi:hypothetical protein
MEKFIEERILADIFDELEMDPNISEDQASILAKAIANRWSKFNQNIRLRKPPYWI